MNLERSFKRFMKYARMTWLLFHDPKTPIISKALLIVAVLYIISPIDFIPDYIPFAGILDEVIVVPLLFFIAKIFIPKDIVEENMKKIKGIKNPS